MVVSTETYPWNNPFSTAKVQMAERKGDAPIWLDELEEKGWAIVKGVISPSKAEAYRDRANDWLEGFGLGYKRDDPSTWQRKNLPRHVNGGLYSAYSFAHAQFVWDIKSEPGIVSLFEEIWGTDKLTVSFDGGNLAVPLPKDQIDNNGAPWPHSDQSPLKPGLAAIQGLLNILPNGAKDGGLKVLTSSVKLFSEVWKAFEQEAPKGGWDSHDHIRLNEAKVKWLEERGCRWEKPCLEPGDFILWDSRTVHYGEAPQASNHRFAVYVCYKPFDWMSEELREKKKEYFVKGWCTVSLDGARDLDGELISVEQSHDPCTFIPKRDQDADWNINHPYGPPTLNEKALKAVGMLAY